MKGKERKGKEKKGKKEYFDSAIYYASIVSKRSDKDHTVLPANTPRLPFLRKRLPDDATSNWGSRHLVAAYYTHLSTPKRWKAELAWLVDL